jgi:hypothetical protein
LGGSYWWDNANPNATATTKDGRFVVTKNNQSNGVSLGGYITSDSRIWV